MKSTKPARIAIAKPNHTDDVRLAQEFARGTAAAREKIGVMVLATKAPKGRTRIWEDAQQDFICLLLGKPDTILNYRGEAPIESYLFRSVNNMALSRLRKEKFRNKKLLDFATLQATTTLNEPKEIVVLIHEICLEHFAIGQRGKPRGLEGAVQDGLLDTIAELTDMLQCLLRGCDARAIPVVSKRCAYLLEYCRSIPPAELKRSLTIEAALETLHALGDIIQAANASRSPRAKKEVERKIKHIGLRGIAA
jgi:hypothetical protein